MFCLRWIIISIFASLIFFSFFPYWLVLPYHHDTTFTLDLPISRPHTATRPQWLAWVTACARESSSVAHTASLDTPSHGIMVWHSGWHESIWSLLSNHCTKIVDISKHYPGVVQVIILTFLQNLPFTKTMQYNTALCFFNWYWPRIVPLGSWIAMAAGRAVVGFIILGAVR